MELVSQPDRAQFAVAVGGDGTILGTLATTVLYLVALVAVLLATVLEGVYFMKIAHALFEGEPPAKHASFAPYRLTFLFPALLLAAAVILLGLMPGLIDPWLGAGTAELLNPGSGYAAHILASGGAQ